jgi:hypothetical protein
MRIQDIVGQKQNANLAAIALQTLDADQLQVHAHRIQGAGRAVDLALQTGIKSATFDEESRDSGRKV